MGEIQIPVLVANGSDDLLVPTENSWVLYRKLVNANAHLHLYPDSGHGFLDEYPPAFQRLSERFLGWKGEYVGRWPGSVLSMTVQLRLCEWGYRYL